MNNSSMKNGAVALLLILLSFFFSTKVLGQRDFVPQVMPKSPEAAALYKYKEIPIGLYTGTPNINIPLGEIGGYGLSVPISMSYHAAGHKVDEIANWVGLGWKLNAGGMITRKVNGLPDDDDLRIGFLEGRCQYSYNSQHGGNSTNLVGKLTEQDYNFYAEFANNCRDAQPDEFFFSVGGQSGSFIFDWNCGELPVIVSDSKFVVLEYSVTSDPTKNKIVSFTLLGPDGIKYIFDQHELTTNTVDGFYYDCNVSYTYVSSWYLSKIVHPNDENVFIDLFYDDYTIDYDWLATESKTFTHLDNPLDPDGFSYCGGNVTGSVSAFSSSRTSVSGKRIESIEPSFDNKKVLFGSWNSRTDTDGTFYTNNFKRLDGVAFVGSNGHLKSYSFDYFYQDRLMLGSIQETGSGGTEIGPPWTFQYDSTPISPQNDYSIDHWGFSNNAVNNTLIPSYTIPFDDGSLFYYFSGADREPTLAGSKASVLEQIVYPTGGYTQFDYELHDYGHVSMKPVSDFEQFQQEEKSISSGVSGNFGSSNWVIFSSPDFVVNETIIAQLTFQGKTWATFGGLTVLPTIWVEDASGNVIYTSGLDIADINNPGQLQSGSEYLQLVPGTYYLKCKAKHATGASTVDQISGTLGYTDIIPDQPLDQKNAGGVRIKEMKTYDSDNTLASSQKYDYKDNAGVSSGVIIAEPIYGYEKTRFFYIANGGSTLSYTLCNTTEMLGGSRMIIGQTSGSHIGYDQVTVMERNGENGKTVHEFKSPKDVVDQVYNELPFRDPWSKDYKRGMPTKTTHFDNSNEKILETVNQYVYKTVQIPTAKIGFGKFGARPSSQDMANHYDTELSFEEKFAFTFVPRELGYSQLSTKVNTYFHDGIPVETVHGYTYDQQLQNLREDIITNADGIKYITRHTYPKDFTTTGNILNNPIFLLANKNIVSTPIETTQWVMDKNVKKCIGGTVIEYQELNGKVLPFKKWDIETELPIAETSFQEVQLNNSLLIKDARYKEVAEITGYDNFQPNEFNLDYDEPSSILWGHNQVLPVANAVNASHNEIHHNSFEFPSNDWILRSGATIKTDGGHTGQSYLRFGNSGWATYRESTLENQQGRYSFSGWLRGSGSARLQINVFKTSNNALVSNSLRATTSLSTEWQYKMLTLDLEKVRAENGLSVNEGLWVKVYVIRNSGAVEIDELRFLPADAQMTTVSYDPNTHQVTDITNENNITSYFEYDEFQRLSIIRDQDRNVISQNDYHYKGTGSTENYVRNRTFLKEGLNPVDWSNINLSDKAEVYQYFDGLGRIIQTVATRQSPLQNDVIQLTQYDEFERVAKQLLPYTITSADGAYRTNADTEQASFHNFGISHANTPFPFAETEFEPSPLNRAVKQSAPGQDWKSGSGNEQEMGYETNVHQEVIDFKNGGYYAPKTLHVTTRINENGHKTKTYTDKLGRQIMTAREVENGFARTYYRYDEFGNLQTVIPPQAAIQLGGTINLGTVANLIYEYRYDERQRLIEKKIPGADWIHYVYDKLDRPVQTQDGNQRNRNEWTFTKYDILGRQIITGLYTNSSSRAGIQNWISVGNENGSIPLYEVPDTEDLGYSSDAIPKDLNDINANVQVLSVTWYDTYDFNQDGTNDYNYIANSEYANNIPSYRLKNQITGKKVRILGTNDWLNTVSFYDEKGNVIQVQTDNHLGGTDITDTEYDFVGRVLTTTRIHTRTGGNSITIRQRFDYDHAGRVVNVYHQINDEPEVRLTNSQYNELEQVIEKNLHSTNFAMTTSPNYLQSIDYGYNIRGWLEKINEIVMGTIVAGAEVELMENGTVNIEFDLQKVNGGGKGDIKVESSMEVTKKDGSKTMEMKSKELTLAKETATTNYNKTISIDLSDKVIEKNSLKGALNTLTDRIHAQLVTEGVTNNEFIDAMTAEVHRIFRDDWLRVRSNDDNDDLFSVQINYNNGNFELNAPAQLNGNISNILWKIKGQEVKGYGYQYDKMNRLTNAHFSAITNGFVGWNYTEINRYGVSNLQYDLNGNILSLDRQGMNGENNNSPIFGTIDALSYVYDGNQLTKVSDASASDHGFKDGANFNIEYIYDANGNIIEDKNKGITVIYNHLNLPERIEFSPTKRLEWLYDAAGAKLQKKVFDNGVLISTKDYSSGIEYTNGDLEALYHEAGRAVWANDPNGGPILTGYEQFRYEYTLSDHLGNSRLMFSDLDADGMVTETEVLQVNDYYPFGLVHEGMQTPQIGSQNFYQYNGKELNTDLGLKWVDYHARWLMPELGLFTTLDPLAEESHLVDWSPYHYTYNNPILFVDPDGQSPVRGALALFKLSKKALKTYKRGDKFDFKDFAKDEIFDILENGATIVNPNSSLWEKVVAAGELASGLELDALSPKKRKKFQKALNATQDNLLDALSLDTPIPVVRAKKGKSRKGRSGKQARLREWMNDPKASSADRGWLRNDQRHIRTGNKKALRIPRNGRSSPGRKKKDKGYELAHPHDKPASEGNGYKGSKVKNHADHKVETRIFRKRGKY